MKFSLALAAALVTLGLPSVVLANQPDVSLAATDRVAEDVAADTLAQELFAAITASQFAIDLPDDFLSVDPNYDPLANWSPE